MRKETKKKMSATARNSLKKEYNRQWYLANRMYKKTYARLHRKDRKLQSVGAEWDNQFGITVDVIVADRKSQISRGLWLDERNGKPYFGIKNS